MNVYNKWVNAQYMCACMLPLVLQVRLLLHALPGPSQPEWTCTGREHPLLLHLKYMQTNTFHFHSDLLLFLLSEQSRKWFTTYLQPASCRNRQSGTSGSSCRGAAACPSNLTPEINWTCFFTYAFFLTTHFIGREKRDFPKDDSQLWGVFIPQSDLEVFLHGFSDMCDVMRRSDQVVSGIKHRLHRQMSYPESWEIERRLKSFRFSP